MHGLSKECLSVPFKLSLWIELLSEITIAFLNEIVWPECLNFAESINGGSKEEVIELCLRVSFVNWVSAH